MTVGKASKIPQNYERRKVDYLRRKLQDGDGSLVFIHVRHRLDSIKAWTRYGELTVDDACHFLHRSADSVTEAKRKS
jgi:hypothetical protein